MATTEEVFSLLCTVRGSEELTRVEQDLEQLEAKHYSLSQAVETTSTRTMNLGRTMLESGRIAQDFAQGGIGGILNNIEGLAMALGLGGGVAGLLTAVGVGAVFVAPKLIDFARSLVEAKQAVPPLANEVDALTEAQKANGKEIDELRKKGSLYSDDMARLNELTAKARQLEIELAEARERAAQVKKMEALREPEVVGEEKARSKILTDRLAGDQASIEAGLVQVATAEEEARISEKWSKDKKDVAERLKAEAPMEKMFGPTFTGMQLREQQEALKVRPSVDDLKIQKQAADLLGGAFAGKAGDWARVEAVMTAHPEVFSAVTRKAFAETSPNALAQAKAEEEARKVDEQMDKEVKTFRANAMKDAAQKKKQDDDLARKSRQNEKLLEDTDANMDKLAMKWKEDKGEEIWKAMHRKGKMPKSFLEEVGLMAPTEGGFGDRAILKEGGGATDVIQQLKETNEKLQKIAEATEKTAEKKDGDGGVILRGPSQR